MSYARTWNAIKDGTIADASPSKMSVSKKVVKRRGPPPWNKSVWMFKDNNSLHADGGDCDDDDDEYRKYL